MKIGDVTMNLYGMHLLSNKPTAILIMALFVLPLGAMGSDMGPMDQDGRGVGSRAVITLSGTIYDGASVAPPKAYIVAANGSTMAYVNSTITFDGNYSMDIPSNDYYLIFMVPFSGQIQDGWEIHGFFPIARFLNIGVTDLDSNFTITPAYELILNGTNSTHDVVDNGNFTNSRWSTGMNDTASFAVWGDVSNSTGFKLPSVLIPLNEVRDLWFQWDVPGFGSAMVRVDNSSNGYSSTVQGAQIIDVNHDVAFTQLSRMQGNFANYFQKGYEFSEDTMAHLENATTACENSGSATGTDRLNKLNKCSARALLGIESMELDRARRDIETYRKGDVNLEVVDANDIPIEGAQIDYRQTSHDFLFGIFDNLNEAGLERFQMLHDIGVNYATSGFYWHISEPSEDNYAFAAMNSSWGFKELTDMGYQLKAHALIYMMDLVTPDYMKAKNFTEYKAKVYDHVYTLVNTYKKYINVWNVVNEAHQITASGGFTRDQVTSIIKTGIKAIRDANPDGEIIVNDAFDWFGQTRSIGYYVENYDDFTIPIEEYLDLLDRENVDYDIIGQQMYNGGYSTLFERLGIGPGMPVTTFDLGFISSVFDKLSVYDKPIHMTEASVSGWWNETWNGAGYWHGKWNETLQAEYLEQFYTIGFSKEKVKALTWWDIDDNTSFIDGGGLFDLNMRPKMAFYTLADLIENWTTNDADTTNGTGKAHFRGFGGDYTMNVTWKGITKDISFHVNETGNTNLFVKFDNETLKPDLEVRPWEIVTNMDGFEDTGMVSINTTINNVGERDTSNIDVKVVQRSTGNWTPIAHDTLTSTLDKDDSLAFDIQWNASGLFGNYTVRVMVDPYDNITELNETNNNVSVPLTLPLPNWGWLDVEVVDNSTDDILANASARIRLENGSMFYATTTNASGELSYDTMPIGCYSIETQMRGYLISNTTFCIEKAKRLSLQIRLDRITKGHIVGAVFDNSTKDPIEGATLTIGTLDLEARTNIDGGFAFFDLEEGDYIVDVLLKGYIGQNSTIRVEANRSVTLNFFLDVSTGDLMGNVTDNETKEPIADATILIKDVMGQISDQNGHYLMLNLPVGEHSVEVGAGDHVGRTLKVNITSGKTTYLDIALDPVIQPLDPNGTISGLVLKKNGEDPIPRASIYIQELDVSILTTKEGAFRLTGVTPGTYMLEVTALGYKAQSMIVSLGPHEDRTLTFYMVKKKADRPEQNDLGGYLLLATLILAACVVVLIYLRARRRPDKGPIKDDGEVGEDLDASDLVEDEFGDDMDESKDGDKEEE